MNPLDAASRIARLLLPSAIRSLTDAATRQGSSHGSRGSRGSGTSGRSHGSRTAPGTHGNPRQRQGSQSATTNSASGTSAAHQSNQPYLGDWSGALPATTWAPKADGRPDPGEVVWAWVPYEEDHSQGKDRPVMLIAEHPTDAGVFLALPLTSKDHDRDETQEARAGRRWMDVGSGPWDRNGRPSEVRLNRVLQLRENEIRREGAALPRDTFDAVLAAARTAL